MTAKGKLLIAIGELAERTGTSVSAIRFYEARGLLQAIRSAGGRRQFLRADIRRLSFILISQKLGFTLAESQAQLAELPAERTPTKKDWSRISKAMRADLDARIDQLTRLRDRLDGCIGCGCLSLKACALYNPDDRVRAQGSGPRLVMDDGFRGEE